MNHAIEILKKAWQEHMVGKYICACPFCKDVTYALGTLKDQCTATSCQGCSPPPKSTGHCTKETS